MSIFASLMSPDILRIQQDHRAHGGARIRATSVMTVSSGQRALRLRMLSEQDHQD